MKKQNKTELQGILERIIFLNDESQFCIGEFKSSKEGKNLTIKGTLPGVQCGETLHLHGHWERHPKHGDQFNVTQFKSILPSTVYGIRRYLGSGLVPGIGKVYADKIVERFGADTLRIISEESARLKEVSGIGRKRIEAIKSNWIQQEALRDVMTFLQTYGVSVAQCLRIVRRYGPSAKRIVREEPYKVARDIPGIGFKSADKIAINIGFANDSKERIEAGIHYALQSLEDEGHTGFPFDSLATHSAELLQAKIDSVRSCLASLVEKKELVFDSNHPLVQLPTLDQAERTIAQAIRKISTGSSHYPGIKVEIAINWAQERANMPFAEDQKHAIRTALTEKVSIITGGPGTGKTTILKAVVEILKAKKVNVLLASPTGRAAQRMSEATGNSAQTIHRMLKFDPAKGKFSVNHSSPLKADVLIVDEVSMLDCRLAAALLQSIPSYAHLVLVGDIDQLPSVGSGNILTDLINSQSIPVTLLSTIFRQKEESDIIKVAYRILNGNPSPPRPTTELSSLHLNEDLQFLKTTSPQECVELIADICKKFFSAQTTYDPIMDVQVLAPLHKGIAGIRNLNLELQARLNPNDNGLYSGNTRFLTGDKVIQTRNNYDKSVFNGDIGKVVTVEHDESRLTVEFMNETVVLDRFEISDLQLAYTTSVHKAQGSEFPIVIIPLLKQHYIMLQRNLLYTAITRGKHQVFIVGDPAAYAIAVNNKESAARFTGLRSIIEKWKE